MIKRVPFCFLGLVGGLALVCAPGFAALYVVPTANTSTEGNSSDNAPLGATEQHFQQVFSPALLSALPGGSQIVGMAFRVNGAESGVPAQTVANFVIRMSQSAHAPGSLSSIFADNQGPDDTLVRSGPLEISAGQFPGGSTPNAFGIIPFDTPYAYTGGNLLIDVAFQGFTSGRNADAVYPYTSGLAQAAFGTGFSATTADVGIYNEAIVFGLDVVPEPVGTGLMAVGVLAVCVAARHLCGRFGRRPVRAATIQ